MPSNDRFECPVRWHRFVHVPDEHSIAPAPSNALYPLSIPRCRIRRKVIGQKSRMNFGELLISREACSRIRRPGRVPHIAMLPRSVVPVNAVQEGSSGFTSWIRPRLVCGSSVYFERMKSLRYCGVLKRGCLDEPPVAEFPRTVRIWRTSQLKL